MSPQSLETITLRRGIQHHTDMRWYLRTREDPYVLNPVSWVRPFNFYNSIVPLRLLPWEIRVAFLREKPAATESRYKTYGASWRLEPSSFTACCGAGCTGIQGVAYLTSCRRLSSADGHVHAGQAVSRSPGLVRAASKPIQQNATLVSQPRLCCLVHREKKNGVAREESWFSLVPTLKRWSKNGSGARLVLMSSWQVWLRKALGAGGIDRRVNLNLPASAHFSLQKWSCQWTLKETAKCFSRLLISKLLILRMSFLMLFEMTDTVYWMSTIKCYKCAPKPEARWKKKHENCTHSWSL